MNRQLHYQGKILRLVTLDGRWEVIEHAPAVCVLALRPAGTSQTLEVLGVRQLRPAIGTATWELPAGLVDSGESPETAAARELAEETQFKAKLERIAEIHSSPGFCDEKVFIFEAHNLEASPGTPDEGEELTLEWRELRSTWEQIRSGRLASSAHTLMALTYALGKHGLLAVDKASDSDESNKLSSEHN